MSYSFSFDGEDMADYGLWLTEAVYPALSEPRIDLQEFASADGGATQGVSFGALKISTPCIVKGDSLDDLLSKLRNIATILMRGQGGEKELIFDEWDDRIWEARLSSGMQPDIRGFGATMTLEFLCPNPNSKAAALSSGSFNLAGDTAGGAINTGNTETDTTWTIKNGASEAAGGISIYNETRGELFVWDNVLTANAWLKIDSSDMNAWVSTDSGGTWTLSNANSTGVAPKLDAGLNAITVYGCVSGEADFEYYERNK